jgi:hypothetical protein
MTQSGHSVDTNTGPFGLLVKAVTMSRAAILVEEIGPIGDEEVPWVEIPADVSCRLFGSS